MFVSTFSFTHTYPRTNIYTFIYRERPTNRNRDVSKSEKERKKERT